MSKKTNCFKVHPEREPGPCIHCERHNDRYIHLIQKKPDNYDFFQFIVQMYNYSESACICRTCEMKFKRAFAKVTEENEIGVSSSKKTCSNIDGANESKSTCFLHNFNLCSEKGDHLTSIDPNLLERKFDINFLDKFSDKCNVNGILCHIHYNALSNFKREISQHVECVICEKSSSKRFISIVKENVDIFTKYLTLELQHDTDVDTKEKIFCCSLCYKNFNAFCRSDAGEDLKYQTSQYMCEQVYKFKFDESVSQENIDLYTFEQIKDIVLESFLKEESLLLPNIYEKFKQYLYINIAKFEYVISETDLKKLQHNNKWIFKMLKIRFSKTANSCLPDIHAFDAKHEINQIPPVLWNFLYRLSATDKEDKEFVKTVASWDHHYIETPFNVNRAFPRFYMCSCIFNCQNAQCVQPLHLLVTDICDKFSNASSTFLSINARLGLGVSKDSLRRYITKRCRQLEQQQRFLTSNSFVVASFDNLDKNQSYSVVGVGKDKSGFHGTTIQAVTPCPSLFTSISSSESCGTDLDDSVVPLLVNGISSEANIITSDIKSSSCEVDLISSAVAIVDKVSTCTALSRDRSLTCDFIQSIVNPDDKIGPS
ncbi:unnamed protein product [Mytilus edulis]|uniref:Uncharacterized protein n=1 Tax=Mytilus edulis TaxID=6550 RepID=A0A8S3U3S0_MYTED|nr:unnamed protein product [Mytilus edulis]